MPQWSYDAEGNLVYVNEDGSTTSYGPTPPVETVAPSAPPTPAVPPAPEVDPGQSESYSFSYSGYDPARERAARTEREKAFAGIDRQAAEDFTRLGKPTVYAAQKRMDAVGTAEELADAPSRYAAESSKMRKEAELTAFMAEQEKRYANEELNAQAASEAVVNKAKAEFISEVQAFKAMKVDPNAWFQDSSSATKGATLISAFAAGFLNAGGIQNDIMGTLNRAIDRNIDAQRFNIQKQGQTVDMFGQLYQMAVQKSATDAEARLRVRAMLRESAKTAVLAELMRYDAPIAQAKAAEAHAMFLDQLNKDLIQLDGMLNQRAQASKQLYLQGVQTDLEAAKFSFAKSQAAQEREDRLAAAGAPDPAMMADGLWDVETSEYVGYIGHLSDTEKKELKERQRGMYEVASLAKHFKELNDRASPTYDGPLGKLTQDQYENAYRAAWSRYISAKSLMITGKASSEKEADRIAQQLSFKRELAAENQKTIAAEIQWNIGKAKADMYQNVMNPDDMVRAGLMSPQQRATLSRLRGGGTGTATPTMTAMGTESGDILEGRSGKPTNTPTDDAVQAISRKGANVKAAFQAITTKAVADSFQSKDPTPLVETIEALEPYALGERKSDELSPLDAAQMVEKLSEHYTSITGKPAPSRVKRQAEQVEAEKAAKLQAEGDEVVQNLWGGSMDYLNDPNVIGELGQ